MTFETCREDEKFTFKLASLTLLGALAQLTNPKNIHVYL